MIAMISVSGASYLDALTSERQGGECWRVDGNWFGRKADVPPRATSLLWYLLWPGSLHH